VNFSVLFAKKNTNTNQALITIFLRTKARNLSNVLLATLPSVHKAILTDTNTLIQARNASNVTSAKNGFTKNITYKFIKTTTQNKISFNVRSAKKFILI
jgi:hypothetical protein